MALPVARHDLPQDCFPFVVQALSTRDGTVVWERTIKRAENVYIPPLAKQIGCPVKIRLIWPDGTVEEQDPPT